MEAIVSKKWAPVLVAVLRFFIGIVFVMSGIAIALMLDGNLPSTWAIIALSVGGYAARVAERG